MFSESTIIDDCSAMRKQRSPSTMSSYPNLSEWQVSSLYSNPPWSEIVTFDPNQTSSVYQDIPHYDYFAAGDMPSQNLYFQNTGDYPETIANGNYVTYDYSESTTDYFPWSRQSVNDYSANNYDLPTEDDSHLFEGELLQQNVLQYGRPTVTDYGTVALLLRHLIRVDLIPDGSVSVYNYPAMCVATLNAAGSKCYVKHPNGQVFQTGPVIDMTAGKDRLVKISRRGVTFSSAQQSLAYIVDESGTKTTTGKFADLSNDLTLDVFYDDNQRSHEDLAQESLGMVAEGTYENCSDGSELWELGKITVVQNRWGQVTVTQKNSEAITVTTSPTIRKVTVESPSVSISIGCYSKNYLTVRKDTSVVMSGYCGLIVQNQRQKAGLDRMGRLVLF